MRARSGSFTATTCRSGCFTKRTSPGGWSATRPARPALSGDAGAHWFDLAQHLTGLRVESVLADLTTAIKTRKRPVGEWREAFAEGSGGATEDFTVTVDDLSSVLLRFDNGAVGNFFGCQLCAGHKNDLRIEVNGSRCSLAWEQERPNELWIGRRGAG